MAAFLAIGPYTKSWTTLDVLSTHFFFIRYFGFNSEVLDLYG